MIDWTDPRVTVRKARHELGLSASAFAEQLRLGIWGSRTVRRWEAGELTPSGTTQLAIEYLLKKNGR